MSSSPIQERKRLTISVTPEVYEIFSRMAENLGVSLGRCMGDWLADTAEGAQFVAQKVHDAKHAPMTVMRELQAMTTGLGDAIQLKADEWRLQGINRPALPSPPSSNTGGKVPPPPRRKPTGNRS